MPVRAVSKASSCVVDEANATTLAGTAKAPTMLNGKSETVKPFVPDHTR
jgi:hypothetical protein